MVALESKNYGKSENVKISQNDVSAISMHRMTLTFKICFLLRNKFQITAGL
tara:strand:+ start:515 stop:667 length:153 start_codon:yes stop_codon:yes gene_type:complete